MPSGWAALLYLYGLRYGSTPHAGNARQEPAG